MPQHYTINTFWDAEAGVWVATSDDAPGLVTEADTREAGCYLVRQGKGDHEIWYSPITDRNFHVDSSIKSRHTANAVLKQAGLAKHF